MIRQATADDVRMIEQLHEEHWHAPQDADAMRQVIEDPETAVHVNIGDHAPAVLMLRVNHEHREVRIGWLYPRRSDFATMIPLMAAAVLDVNSRYSVEQIGEYRIGGEVPSVVKDGRDQGERALRSWQAIIERAGIPAHVEQRGENWYGYILWKHTLELGKKWLDWRL